MVLDTFREIKKNMGIFASYNITLSLHYGQKQTNCANHLFDNFYHKDVGSDARQPILSSAA